MLGGEGSLVETTVAFQWGKLTEKYMYVHSLGHNSKLLMTGFHEDITKQQTPPQLNIVLPSPVYTELFNWLK